MEEQIKVGDGATIVGWSDRHAATVVEVSKNGRQVTLQEDKATLLNGATSGEPDALVVTPGGFACHTEGTQRWGLQRDPEGRRMRFSLRKNGAWVMVGESLKGGQRARIGERHHYYDFNF